MDDDFNSMTELHALRLHIGHGSDAAQLRLFRVYLNRTWTG
jgi:hypothetical protein